MKRFYAQTRLWSDSVDVGILNVEGRECRVVRLELGDVLPEGDAVDEPTARLTPSEARDLMDALWFAGVRPSSGTGNIGQLGATEKHLEDMRKLVFKAVE